MCEKDKQKFFKDIVKYIYILPDTCMFYPNSYYFVPNHLDLVIFNNDGSLLKN